MDTTQTQAVDQQWCLYQLLAPIIWNPSDWCQGKQMDSPQATALSLTSPYDKAVA